MFEKKRHVIGQRNNGADATVGFLDTAGLTAELTGAELTERGRSAAAGLAHNGIGFQDRVIIVEPTGPDYLAVLLGCLLSGVVPATVAAPPKPDDPTSAGAQPYINVIAAREGIAL